MSRRLTSSSRRDGIVLACVNVDIDLSNADQLRDELLRAVTNDSHGLLVDLTDVRYVDSAGVHVFFELARELDIARQVMGIVVPLQSPIRRLVKLTRLDEVAVVEATVDECVGTLTRG